MREAALADAEELLRPKIAGLLGVPLTLTPLDDTALTGWRSQWSPAGPNRIGWNWADQRLALRPTLNRFEVALWSGSVLCGLAIGKPSRGASHLALHLLEGNPSSGHPLKGYVAECLIEAGASYGRVLGKTQLRLLHPLPGALPIYRRLDFTIAEAGARIPYCFKEL